MKYNIWHVEMYHGWYDYDGPEDCNLKRDIIMDAGLKKNHIIQILCSLYSDERTVVVHKCELVKSGQI